MAMLYTSEDRHSRDQLLLSPNNQCQFFFVDVSTSPFFFNGTKSGRDGCRENGRSWLSRALSRGLSPSKMIPFIQLLSLITMEREPWILVGPKTTTSSTALAWIWPWRYQTLMRRRRISSQKNLKTARLKWARSSQITLWICIVLMLATPDQNSNSIQALKKKKKLLAYHRLVLSNKNLRTKPENW